MAHSEPFEQLTGTLTVYIAAVGTTIPDVDETPGADWTEIGCTDGEQSVQNAGALEYFYDNCHQGPVKAVRPEEDVIIAFTLVGLTLENYASVISDVANVITNTTPNPDERSLPLKRRFVPGPYALLFRGEALSPYGALPGMYVIPRGVFDGEPQPTFAKDGRVGLEIEFRALEDTTQATGDELGWLVVEYEAAEAEAECVPAIDVEITWDEVGPTVGVPEEFTAVITPVDATDPVIVWDPEPDSGQGTTVATYTFLVAESLDLNVTVTTCGTWVDMTIGLNVEAGS